MPTGDADFWVGVYWVVGCGVLLIVPTALLIRALRRSAERAALYEVRTLLQGIPIVLSSRNARLRGLRRDWDGQWRGVGVLVLSEEGLYFRPSQNPVDLRIPLNRIISVEGDNRSADGKLGAVRLRVRYHAVDSTERVASWSGVEVPKWIDAINGLRENPGNE